MKAFLKALLVISCFIVPIITTHTSTIKIVYNGDWKPGKFLIIHLQSAELCEERLLAVDIEKRKAFFLKTSAGSDSMIRVAEYLKNAPNNIIFTDFSPKIQNIKQDNIIYNEDWGWNCNVNIASCYVIDYPGNITQKPVEVRVKGIIGMGTMTGLAWAFREEPTLHTFDFRNADGSRPTNTDEVITINNNGSITYKGITK
jgi:hypothetical protein